MATGQLVDDMFGPAWEGPAEDVIIEAWDAETPAKRNKLAKKALELDPKCIDAYNLLSFGSAKPSDKIALLRQAVEVGDEIWKPYLNDDEMEWWGFMGTRPYLRAMHNLGLALEDADKTSEAEILYRRLLNLNSNDNQGIRYLLLRMFSGQKRLDDCAAILERYPDDYGLEAMMTDLLLHLSRGDKKALPDLFDELDNRNEHVLMMLFEALDTGRWPDFEGEMIAVGSEDEATAYLDEFSEIWKVNTTAGGLFLDLYAKRDS